MTLFKKYRLKIKSTKTDKLIKVKFNRVTLFYFYNSRFHTLTSSPFTSLSALPRRARFPAPGLSLPPVPTSITPLAGTRPPNQRAISHRTRVGLRGQNNKHSSREAPPYSAHSEFGSVRRAKFGSAGPTASNHAARANDPRTASASSGPIVLSGGAVVAVDDVGGSRSAAGYRRRTPDNCRPSCNTRFRIPMVARGSRYTYRSEGIR